LNNSRINAEWWFSAALNATQAQSTSAMMVAVNFIFVVV
jgi:hypothetical protein